LTGFLDAGLVARATAAASLEWKLTDPIAFGLTTASPLQRAICRIADGESLGALSEHPRVVAALGDVHALPHERPKEMFVISGIRTAKSLIAACGAFHMAMTADCSQLRPGEIPRVSVVSLKKDLSDVIMNHLVGSVKASPLLRRFMVGDPSGDGIVLRRPDDRLVEVCVVAGSRAGSSLVARWSAGCIFDEFPRMVGGDEGVVNWDDMRQAVLLRVLRGCQLWHIGSPWAPWGPAYEAVTEHHGKPTAERILIKAPAYDMNPVYWTAERVAAARKADPDAAKTDVDAEFASAEEAMFAATSVDACTRKAPLVIPRADGHTYFAAMDPATRGNGWTLAIATKDARGKVVVVCAKEWKGSRDEPLDPGDVLAEVASVVVPYGITTVFSDQVMGDALRKLARQNGLELVQLTYVERERAKKYLTIRTHLDRKAIELPPVKAMRTDLLHVQKRPTPAGIGVRLPMTSDGRHCDWAPTLMLVLSRLLPDPDLPDPSPKRGDDPETKALREAVLARMRPKEW
jgi:hypothetical protein